MDFNFDGTKSPEPLGLQNIHPPKPLVPSLVGQVQPASIEILYTFLLN